MIFCYGISLLFSLAGMAIFIIYTRMLVKTLLSEKIPARIVSADNQSWNHGNICYLYELNIHGQIKRIMGPQNIQIDPLEGLISGTKSGKEVYVVYDEKTNKILPRISTIILFLSAGAVLICVGVLCYILLRNMFL